MCQVREHIERWIDAVATTHQQIARLNRLIYAIAPSVGDLREPYSSITAPILTTKITPGYCIWYFQSIEAFTWRSSRLVHKLMGSRSEQARGASVHTWPWQDVFLNCNWDHNQKTITPVEAARSRESSEQNSQSTSRFTNDKHRVTTYKKSELGFQMYRILSIEQDYRLSVPFYYI